LARLWCPNARAFQRHHQQAAKLLRWTATRMQFAIIYSVVNQFFTPIDFLAIDDMITRNPLAAD